jgi:MFS family permease
VGSIALSTLLPFQMVALGGSGTQVGLLFSVTTLVSMVLRPTIGGWVDRVGARAVLIPGTVALALTSLGLQLAGTPATLIALMIGLGLANGLISTPASVLTAVSTAPAHRGEALGTYYLASSVGIAVAPPFAFAMQAAGGPALAFAAVTAVALVIAWLVARVPGGPPAAARGEGAPFRLLSPGALGVSGALVLATLGHSAVYAFLPLYALSRGRAGALAWFFGIYPLWMIGCRALLRGIADRVSRIGVALSALVLQGLGYFVLALPPTPATLVTAAVALGSGAAVLYPTLAALVVDRAPERERGLALGTLSGAWDLGVVVGSALVGAVADRVSYGAGFAVGGAGCVLGLVALSSIEARRRTRPSTGRVGERSEPGWGADVRHTPASAPPREGEGSRRDA